MSKNTSDWSGEFKRFRPIEDGEPLYYQMPTGAFEGKGDDLRHAIKKAAMEYGTLDLGLVIEVTEERIPYAEAGSRHALVLCGDDAQMFFVLEGGLCPGLAGYFKLKSAAEVTASKVYQMFVIEEGYGFLVEVPTVTVL